MRDQKMATLNFWRSLTERDTCSRYGIPTGFRTSVQELNSDDTALMQVQCTVLQRQWVQWSTVYSSCTLTPVWWSEDQSLNNRTWSCWLSSPPPCCCGENSGSSTASAQRWYVWCSANHSRADNNSKTRPPPHPPHPHPQPSPSPPSPLDLQL